jgi:uncharacterized membrane protein YqiK
MEDYSFLIIAGAILAFILIIGFVFAKLYVKAPKEYAFVRTGGRGELIVKDGGALVFGLFHEIIKVNLQTIKLVISGKREEALITKDKLRIDVEAEFYVRVEQSEENISTAARTLGNKTMNPSELKALIQGKFVDGLRSVAAEMTMNQLHEDRKEFVTKVQNAVKLDLEKNGLELESVSLTALDQTSTDFFDENNAFDAEGLKNLALIRETALKQKNVIEQEARIAIETKNLEAHKKSLDLSQEEEFATIQQASIIAIERAEKNRLDKEAQITSDRAIEEAEIERRKKLEEAEIAKSKSIEEAEIDKNRAIEEAKINKRKIIDERNIEAQIIISGKEKEEADSQTLSNKAKALEVTSKEAIETAKQVEEANRDKTLTILKAEEEAESIKIAIKVKAQAEKEAAEDKAEAIKIEAEAMKIKYKIDADGVNSMNEAQNILSSELINKEVRLRTIDQMPEIIAQMVKPMENIDSIKIANVNGIGGTGATSGTGGSGTSNVAGGLSNDIVNAALAYKMNSPMIDELMGSIGIGSTSKIEDMVPNFMKSTDSEVETKTVTKDDSEGSTISLTPGSRESVSVEEILSDDDLNPEKN